MEHSARRSELIGFRYLVILFDVSTRKIQGSQYIFMYTCMRGEVLVIYFVVAMAKR